MKTEQEITRRDVERTATLTLVRTLDLDALADKHPKGIPPDVLRGGGTFEIVIEPNGRGKPTTRQAVESAELGAAWIDGFAACNEFKKKGPRAAKPNGAAKGKAPAKGKAAAKGARK